MIVAEAERQFYLEQAGIQLWYARDALPGAAASRSFLFGVSVSPAGTGEAAVSAAGGGQSETANTSQNRVADLRSLVAGNTSARSEKKARVTVSQGSGSGVADQPAAESVAGPEPAPSAAAGVPRLTLAAWQGRRVALLASLSDNVSSKLQSALALNILRSLGELEPKQLPILSWPLFNNLRVSLNSQDNLVALIRSEFGSVAANGSVILLGAEQSGSGELVAQALGRTPDVAFASTLAALAGDAALKEQLWSSLRCLVR